MTSKKLNDQILYDIFLSEAEKPFLEISLEKARSIGQHQMGFLTNAQINGIGNLVTNPHLTVEQMLEELGKRNKKRWETHKADGGRLFKSISRDIKEFEENAQSTVTQAEGTFESVLKRSPEELTPKEEREKVLYRQFVRRYLTVAIQFCQIKQSQEA